MFFCRFALTLLSLFKAKLAALFPKNRQQETFRGQLKDCLDLHLLVMDPDAGQANRSLLNLVLREKAVARWVQVPVAGVIRCERNLVALEEDAKVVCPGTLPTEKVAHNDQSALVLDFSLEVAR